MDTGSRQIVLQGGGEAVGYGSKLFVPNINTQRNGGQSPFASEDSAASAKGYALGAEAVSSAAGCISK